MGAWVVVVVDGGVVVGVVVGEDPDPVPEPPVLVPDPEPDPDPVPEPELVPVLCVVPVPCVAVPIPDVTLPTLPVAPEDCVTPLIPTDEPDPELVPGVAPSEPSGAPPWPSEDVAVVADPPLTAEMIEPTPLVFDAEVVEPDPLDAADTPLCVPPFAALPLPVPE